MITNRLIYAFTLVAAILFYFLYPPWISWYLLVLLLLLIPLDLLISLPGMLSMGIMISAPDFIEKNADGVLVLTLIHSKSYPVKCVIAKLHVTGDDFSVMRRIRCGTEAEGRREVTIDTTQTGVTVFELKRIRSVSLIGLFSLPINAVCRTSVLVLPPPVKPANTIALQHGTHLKPKPGGGFSEEHDMREYHPGDPVRSIHWKISAKFDSIIIREPLAPPPHSRLVHIIKWDGATQRDLILGCLRWISDYLLKWQMPFYIKFNEKAVIAEIKQESDLTDFLLKVLDGKTTKTIAPEFLPSRFSWIYRVDSNAIAGLASGTAGANEANGVTGATTGTGTGSAARKQEDV